MNIKCNLSLMLAAAVVLSFAVAEARIKLVALPERTDTVVRLDNPQATLIEEERVLTLQKGVNKVDFSWNGVSIDADSIRLQVLDNPDKVVLLNVSYPPNEPALVWEISSNDALEERVRISYLLSNIDRLITYKAVANKAETDVGLKSFLVLRNFSGEDFENARVLLDYGEAFEEISCTRRLSSCSSSRPRMYRSPRYGLSMRPSSLGTPRTWKTGMSAYR